MAVASADHKRTICTPLQIDNHTNISFNLYKLDTLPDASVHHQAAKLVAALLRVAGVTAGLTESNGSLPPGLYDSRHLQADCQEPGSDPEPYAR